MDVVVRKTRSLCPECAKEVDGAVVVSDGKAWLDRTCPDHGSYRFLLSLHGDEYADLDAFYARLSGFKGRRKITNVWIVTTSRCQQDCPYCNADVKRNVYSEMGWEEILGILNQYGNVKYTFSGGEPTLHPNVLDFFQEARRRRLTTQLATNGVLLASKEYCQKLHEAGVNEVRLSIESVHRKEADALNLGEFFEAKLQAIDNAGEAGMTIALSPTIFKGLNEEQLFHILEYAKDRPHIRELTVAGFAWNGAGAGLPPEMMMSPDEMMDVLHRHYGSTPRAEIFTFQKALLAMLHLVGYRLCINSQVIVFVRDKRRGLVPIVEYLSMSRMEKGLRWWARLRSRNRLTLGLLLLPVLASSVSLRTLPLMGRILRMLWANLAQLDVNRYPAQLLPVILNTNCSTLNADELLGPQCMNGVVVKQNGELRHMSASVTFLDKEKGNRDSGDWQHMRSPESKNMMKDGD